MLAWCQRNVCCSRVSSALRPVCRSCDCRVEGMQQIVSKRARQEVDRTALMARTNEQHSDS